MNGFLGRNLLVKAFNFLLKFLVFNVVVNFALTVYHHQKNIVEFNVMSVSNIPLYHS